MDIRWGRLNSNEWYRTAHEERTNRILGWVVLIGDVWIARTEKGDVRADFATMEEAQDFLTTILKAGEGNE